MSVLVNDPSICHHRPVVVALVPLAVEQGLSGV